MCQNPLPFLLSLCLFTIPPWKSHTLSLLQHVIVTQVSPLHCRRDDTRKWILGDKNHWGSSLSPAIPEWSSQRLNDLSHMTQLASDRPGFEPRSHDMRAMVSLPLYPHLNMASPDEGRGTWWVEGPSAEGQEAWVEVSDLAVTHHVTSGESLPLSGPQFPYLSGRGNNNYFAWCWGE